MLRHIVSLLAVALLAMPTPGDEGGENASGTGVWILPACAAIDPAQVAPTAPTRATFVCSDLGKPVTLQVSQAMGAASATLTFDLLGATVPLQVSGRTVVVTPSLMTALTQSPSSTATLLISDSHPNGYVMRLRAVGATVRFDLK